MKGFDKKNCERLNIFIKNFIWKIYDLKYGIFSSYILEYIVKYIYVLYYLVFVFCLIKNGI